VFSVVADRNDPPPPIPTIPEELKKIKRIIKMKQKLYKMRF
jgi:hypothetical protein